jgi:glycosyltransferase involved in cell wall biosynthesis
MQSAPMKNASPSTLSILIPVYNERYHVADLLERVLAVKFQDGVQTELVVVDDCSTDGTEDVLRRWAEKEPRIRLIRHERNQGKGAAIRTAIGQARGDIMVIQDADLEYDPAELPRLLRLILAGQADVVYGSRFLFSDHKRVLFFWHHLGNSILTFLSNVFTNLDLTDMETCYKMTRASILKSIPIRSNRFGIEPELTAKFAKRKCRIYEVPISYEGRTYHEGKKITWKDGCKAIAVILRYWFVDDVYEEHFGHNILLSLSRTHRTNRWMADAIRPYVGDRVLEIGAGMGNITTELLPRDAYTATDIDELHLDYLQSVFGSRPRIGVERVDVETPEDFARLEGRYDTVVCLNVLEHVDDDKQALRNIHRALQPGGRLCLLVPCGRWLYGTLDSATGHKRRYSTQDLSEMVAAAGFQVEKCFGFNKIAVPGWFLNSRILRRKTFGRLQLKAFDAFVWLWRKIDRWLPWAGISYIVIARKP